MLALLSVAAVAALLTHVPGLATKEATAGGSRAAITGIFPSFDPAERHYVSRCGRGADPIEMDPPAGTTVRVDGQGFGPGGKLEQPAAPGIEFTVSLTKAGARRAYAIRCLPEDFPRWSFESLRPVSPALFVVSFVDPDTGKPWVIAFDTKGTPRWWFRPPTRVLWGQVLADGRLVWARSFGDGYGLDLRMAYEVRTESGQLLDLVRTRGSIVDGHEFHELANGNVLLDSYVPETADLRRVGGPRRAAIVSAEAQELDPAGKVVWRWNSRGHISLGETGRWWQDVLSNPRVRLGGRPTFDPVHINSIEPRGRHEVIISTRHTDAIYGIDRSSGKIRWKLGGTPTGKSLRVVGDPARKIFGGQHDVRIDRWGRLTVYDNGKDRPRRPRVVFYRLDLARRRAVYVGQLNDEQITTSHCCGSARELPGGGWLVSWGDNPLVSGFDSDGRLGFRLVLPASTFRAVPAPPGATSVTRLDHALGHI